MDANWAAIIGVGITAAVSLYLQLRRERKDAKKNKAETDTAFETLADRAGERALKLQERIDMQDDEKRQLAARVDDLEIKMIGMTGRFDKLSKKYEQATRYIEHLLDVIRALTEQLKQVNIIPCAQPDPWKPEE